jgi:hypothetical protein
MTRLINRLFRYANSPGGRRLARQASRYARSPQGRAKIEQVRRQIASRGRPGRRR